MVLEEQVSFKSLTTFRTGGNARYLCRARSVEEISDALHLAATLQLPTFFLGGGSNILVSDNGFEGLVIKIELPGVSFEGQGNIVLATAGAGEEWDLFVRRTLREGLFGIENLSGIPGTVGATPIQNVGAYGTEVSSVIEWVEALDTTLLRLKKFSRDECLFGYRDSFFKGAHGANYVVTRVCFRLRKDGEPNMSYRDLANYFSSENRTPTLPEIRDAVLEIRSGKFPDLKKAGTAGSFFKNPIIDEQGLQALKNLFPELPHFAISEGRFKIALGWILERLGWRGMCRGEAGVFSEQSLVLVNYGTAPAADIRRLAEDMMRDVYVKTGIRIVPEIIFVGDLPSL